MADGNQNALDLNLNLSPPMVADPRPQSPPRVADPRPQSPPRVADPRPQSPAQIVAMSPSSPPSSCVSSEFYQDDNNNNNPGQPSSPEEASLVLVGCPNCLMYMMISENNNKCLKCKSTTLIYFPDDKNPVIRNG